MITKTFVEKYISMDCEARYWEWVQVDDNYEELVEKLTSCWNGWFSGVALVEKTFNPETFKITSKFIKSVKREWGWDEKNRKGYWCFVEYEGDRIVNTTLAEWKD